MPGNDDSRPLRGVRVLELVSGPMAAIGRQLAEFGADVVRLEPAEGSSDRRSGPCAGGIALGFAAANLGKRATTLDRFDRLVGDADILIAPLGSVAATILRTQNPTLVIMTVSDFGDTGRFAGWQGSGPVFHALSGELSRSGIPGREPLLPPGDLNHACASAQAAYALLLAYWNRLKTGVGDQLDFSILDGASQALDPGYGIAGSATAGVPASKLPRGRPEARHQYPIVPCKDGFVRLCVLAPRQWRGMFEWMGRPDEFADPKFDQLAERFKSTTLIPAIAAFFAERTRAQLEAEGQAHGVPTAAVLDLREALATEQMLARKAFVDVEFAPGVSAPFPDGVVEIDNERMGVTGPPPAVSHDLDWLPCFDRECPAAEGERPLSGVRVLDLGVIVVGAETGRLLADQGADVVKVENAAFPDGSRQSRYGGLMSPTFATGHRNKRGLGLNLRDPAGKALLLELVAKSDVVLSNFKGGTLESLGLDYATLKQVNPGIIVTDSSAFGPTGPWSKRMGYGPLVRASAGLTRQWRYPGEPDSFSDAMTVYPDHVASRIGAAAVLALLIRRLRSGIGGSVSVSQAEVMLSHMAPLIARDALEHDDHGVTGGSPESAVYRCFGEDEWCVVTIRDMKDEASIATVTGGVPLADWMAGQESRAAMETLQAAGIAAGAMLRVSELPTFDYHVERRFFREARHPHMPEPFTVEIAPVRSESLSDPLECPAPLLGEHTCEVVRERLGLADTKIAELLEAGALEQFILSQRSSNMTEIQASEKAVLVERRGHVMVITINRPEARNAVNQAVWLGCGEALAEAERDIGVRVVIVIGAGEHSFCAGADLKAISRGDPIAPDDPVKRGWGFCGIVTHTISKPLIAAVNGTAMGGGTEIALASDLVIAADHATFGLPEVKRGLVAGAGGTFRIVRQLPKKVAMEILLTGKAIDAQRAFDLGLVNEVVPAAGLLDAALALANEVASNAPLAVQASKRMALGIENGRIPAEDALWTITQAEIPGVMRSEDAKEGPRAFAEKRKPEWKGR